MSDDDGGDDSTESKAMEALPDSVKGMDNLDIEANSDRSNPDEGDVDVLSDGDED